MMNMELKYGRERIPFDLPPSAIIPEIREPEYTISKKVFSKDLLQSLPADPAKFQRVAIVVSDKTRLCGYPEFLPWLIEVLIQQGASRENISFYIAYGTHPRQTEEESLSGYGEIYHAYRFIHHDCRDDCTGIVSQNSLKCLHSPYYIQYYYRGIVYFFGNSFYNQSDS